MEAKTEARDPEVSKDARIDFLIRKYRCFYLGSCRMFLWSHQKIAVFNITNLLIVVCTV